jgi:hypothetical protein
MGITFGDYRIDSGDYDPPEEETMPFGVTEWEAEEMKSEMGWVDPQAKYQSLLNEFTQQRALLREALITMNHARVFISTREKMHPIGVGLYDDLVEQIEAVLTPVSSQHEAQG